MASNPNKSIIIRRTKAIIVGSESESDSSSNNLNILLRELSETQKRKGISSVSASRSKAYPSQHSLGCAENSRSTTDHILEEILKINVKNQKLLHKFVDQQKELIKLTKKIHTQFNKISVENGNATSDEEEPDLITENQYSALMQERMPSKLITKASYIVWGPDELARKSVRYQKNVTERPLTPNKRKVVKGVYKDWMIRNHWPRVTISEELTKTKMNKYFNGAISAARKKVNYKPMVA